MSNYMKNDPDLQRSAPREHFSFGMLKRVLTNKDTAGSGEPEGLYPLGH